MTDMDKAVIGVLLKSLLEKNLVTESIYRTALDRLSASSRAETKEASRHGYSQNQG